MLDRAPIEIVPRSRGPRIAPRGQFAGAEPFRGQRSKGTPRGFVTRAMVTVDRQSYVARGSFAARSGARERSDPRDAHEEQFRAQRNANRIYERAGKRKTEGPFTPRDLSPRRC